MIAPRGYTSLATLWTEFVNRRQQDIYLLACRRYVTPEFIGTAIAGVKDEFGSPKDLMERAFIETVRPYEISMCGPAGQVAKLPSRVIDGSSDIFDLALVFESTLSCEELGHTDEGRDWLTRMGSSEYSPWPHKLGRAGLWAEAYPVPGQNADLRHLFKSCRFHKLPNWFERHRFVIPSSLPPWSSDLIDTAFTETTATLLLGCSMCLEDKIAEKWRAKNIFQQANLTSLWQKTTSVIKLGRPSKKEDALHYYDTLYPDGNHPSWKVTCQAIRDRFEFDISERTLRRALKGRQNAGQKAE